MSVRPPETSSTRVRPALIALAQALLANCADTGWSCARHRQGSSWYGGLRMGKDGAVILFDGTCAFCQGSVRFIVQRDPRGYFRFGASQSPKGTELLAKYGIARESARSIVLIEDGQVFLRSTAALRIAGRLRWPWAWAAALLFLPRAVRDTGYRIVATLRHRLAGRSNACEVPPPEIRARMI